MLGCVAVSMAQIMHYWSYPEVGSWRLMDIIIGPLAMAINLLILEILFMIIIIWKIITATTESQELLYHCGVAVNMGYGT